jgi:hypothetical protein
LPVLGPPVGLGRSYGQLGQVISGLAWWTAVLEPLGAPDRVTLSAAAVVSLLPVLRARRQAAQQAYRDSPVAYLLRLEEELRPQTMPARAGHCVRRFVTGI